MEKLVFASLFFLQKNHPDPFNHNFSHTPVGDKIHFDRHFQGICKVKVARGYSVSCHLILSKNESFARFFKGKKKYFSVAKTLSTSLLQSFPKYTSFIEMVSTGSTCWTPMALKKSFRQHFGTIVQITWKKKIDHPG